MTRDPEPTASGVSRTFSVDAVDIFLFSAACWLAHRIHYDSAFAREEGLDEIPVPGPLQSAWLAQLAEEWARSRGRRVVTMQVRNVRPAYPGEYVAELTSGDDGTLQAHVRAADGTVVTEGRIGVTGAGRTAP